MQSQNWLCADNAQSEGGVNDEDAAVLQSKLDYLKNGAFLSMKSFTPAHSWCWQGNAGLYVPVQGARGQHHAATFPEGLEVSVRNHSKGMRRQS